MAAYVLSYPFRVDGHNHRMSTVLVGTDTYKAEQISAYVRTEKDHRRIFPQFGITNPLFHEFDVGEFYDGFSDFYSSDDIDVNQIAINEFAGRVRDIQIEFM